MFTHWICQFKNATISQKKVHFLLVILHKRQRREGAKTLFSVFLSKADSIQTYLLHVLHQSCHPHRCGAGSTIRNDRTLCRAVQSNSSDFLSSSSSCQGHRSEDSIKMEDVFKVVARWKRAFIFTNEDLGGYSGGTWRLLQNNRGSFKTGFPEEDLEDIACFKRRARFLHQPLGDSRHITNAACETAFSKYFFLYCRHWITGMRYASLFSLSLVTFLPDTP